jgi:serine protease Do
MIRKSIVYAGLVGSLLVGGGWAADSVELLEKSGDAFARIAEEALPAVVFIDVTMEVKRPPMRGGSPDPFEQFFGQQFGFGRSPYGQRAPQRQFREGQGSGFIISREGHILTNNHVVNDADRIQVTMQDGTTYQATLIGTDPKSEVALIKVESEKEFPFLKLGNSDEIQVGQWVLAAGNPFGLSQTVTAGIISAKGRTGLGITDYGGLIQTDAAINPGNSGGPMLNIRGEVIGINTAIYSRTGGYMGVGFAVPINLAVQVKDQLLEHGKVQRSFLGIAGADVTGEMASFFDMDEARGIIVSQVMPDTAAEAAGLKAEDIILKLNGWEISSYAEFRNRVAAQQPGTTLKLEIVREGREMTIEAVTRSLEGEAVVAGGKEDGVDERLGLRVQELDEEIANQLGVPAGSGVVIAHVEQGSSAWREGLRPGLMINAVNRNPVQNMKEYRTALKNVKGKVLLTVSDGRAAWFVVVRIPKE